MNPRFDDETLGACADGELNRECALAIEAALPFDSALRARLAAIRAAGASARASFADVLSEPVPAALLALGKGKVRRRFALPDGFRLAKAYSGVWRSYSFGLTGALIVLLAVAGGLIASGALRLGGGAQLAENDDQWLEQVRRSYDLYTGIYQSEARTLVDVGGDELSQIDGWFGLHLNRTLDVPDLREHGLTLQGGRLLIIGSAPAAQFMYVAEDGSQIALLIAPSKGRDTLLRSESRTNVRLLHWRTANYAYVLIGGLDIDTMRSLAEEIAPRLTDGA
jgi:anti-sigma factor RsiW